MYTLSILEHGLIVNELLLLFGVALTGSFWCLFNIHKNKSSIYSILTIIFGLIAMEEWFSLQYWDRAFIITESGYIPTGEGTATSIKPLLYVWILALMYYALNDFCAKYHNKYKFKRIIIPVLVSVLAVLASEYIASNNMFVIMLLLSVISLSFMVKYYRNNIQLPLVISNFLLKTPLSRFAGLSVMAWFVYSLYFSLSRADFYGSPEVYCLGYFAFIFTDFIVKTMPACLILNMNSIVNDKNTS